MWYLIVMSKYYRIFFFFQCKYSLPDFISFCKHIAFTKSYCYCYISVDCVENMFLSSFNLQNYYFLSTNQTHLLTFEDFTYQYFKPIFNKWLIILLVENTDLRFRYADWLKKSFVFCEKIGFNQHSKLINNLILRLSTDLLSTFQQWS